MLEVLLIVFLTRKAGRICEEKGYDSKSYTIDTIIMVFGLQLVGLVAGKLVFTDNLFAGYICAVAGFVLGIILSIICTSDIVPARDVESQR